MPSLECAKKPKGVGRIRTKWRTKRLIFVAFNLLANGTKLELILMRKKQDFWALADLNFLFDFVIWLIFRCKIFFGRNCDAMMLSCVEKLQ